MCSWFGIFVCGVHLWFGVCLAYLLFCLGFLVCGFRSLVGFRLVLSLSRVRVCVHGIRFVRCFHWSCVGCCSETSVFIG
jgi:hypothetical protein